MARLVRWEPFGDLMSLREAMNRLFEESVVQPRERWLGESALAVDMYEADEEVVVETALPGVDPEDVDVSVVGDTLAIRAESKAEEEGRDYIRREMRYGAVSRSLRLPTNVKANEATADYSDGKLQLRLPKTEEVKPKQIEIQTA